MSPTRQYFASSLSTRLHARPLIGFHRIAFCVAGTLGLSHFSEDSGTPAAIWKKKAISHAEKGDTKSPSAGK
jgi:hypothetical protein